MTIAIEDRTKQRTPSKSPQRTPLTAPSHRSRVISFEPSNSWLKRFDSEGALVIQAAWADLGRSDIGPKTDSPIVLRKGNTGKIRQVFGDRATRMTPHSTPDKADKAQLAKDWLYSLLRPTDDRCDLTVVVSHWNMGTARDIAKSLMGNYSAVVNGHEIFCRVVKAVPQREGFGSWFLMRQEQRLDPGSTLLIELGHGTTEEWLIDEAGDFMGVPTEALAVRHLVDRLANHPTLLDLAGAGSRGFSPALITAALRAGTSPAGRLPFERWEVIRDAAVDAWFSELKQHLLTAHADSLQHVSSVVLTGGGAALLGDRIAATPFIAPAEPQTASVEGSYRWAMAHASAVAKGA